MVSFDVAGTLDGITTAIIIIVVLGLTGVISFWIYNLSQFKITIVIRDVVKGRNIISFDKARIVKDKNNNYWWKLLKQKAKIPEPSTECIETTAKGKKFAEFYKLKDGGFFPAKSKNGYLSIQSKISEEDFQNIIIEGFEPLTTQERALYTHELKESEKYKQADKHELIARAIPYVALVLILTVLLLFSGEFFSPMFEHQEKMEGLQSQTWDKMEGVIDKMDLVIEDRQRMSPENNTDYLPPN